jgi:type IV pilus assembly protein PilV
MAMSANRQANDRGFVLLDALIALLIFSFGMLGILALQASAIKFGSDAKYRTDAALLADRLIAGMWVYDVNTVVADFKTNGAAFNAWRDNLVDCAKAKVTTNCLPGVAANPPTVVFGDNNFVTITVQWQGPQESAPHTYVTVSQIQQ